MRMIMLATFGVVLCLDMSLMSPRAFAGSEGIKVAQVCVDRPRPQCKPPLSPVCRQYVCGTQCARWGCGPQVGNPKGTADDWRRY
jgi:hypothetical protein